MLIFLDESGDLGWSFESPDRFGGSSRFLTISAVRISQQDCHVLGRLIRKLYTKFSWHPKIEKKWSRMSHVERMYFAKLANTISEKNVSIKYFSIAVYKPLVQLHIRRDSNKLYNYLIKLLLLDEMSKYEQVKFYPDIKSIKINSGNSLNDYLQTELFFTKNVSTKLITIPSDSASNKGIQFADMLSGLIQQHYQDRNSEALEILREKIDLRTWLMTENTPLRQPEPADII